METSFAVSLVLVISTTYSSPFTPRYDGPPALHKMGPLFFNDIQREGLERQIRPMSCSSPTTGEVGICMFAWNCVEARGIHLGTCIDRFYFGSCCKLRNVISVDELDEGNSVPSLPMPNMPSSQFGNVDQPAAPVAIVPVDFKPNLAPVTTTSEPTKTSTVESLTSTITATEPTTAALAVTTTVEISKTSTLIDGDPTTVTTDSVDSITDMNIINIIDAGLAASVSTASVTEQPLESATGSMTEASITEPSGVADVQEGDINAWIILPPVPMEPIAPSAPALGPFSVNSSAIISLGPEWNVSNMTRLDACGMRPWVHADNRKDIYPEGYRFGFSEAPIGGAFKASRRNSKYLRSWNRQSRIVNGQTSDYGEWPWQVSLRQWRTATYLHKCGCALLSENWAITAAHCVENVSPDDLLLRMGEYDLNSMSEPHPHIDRKVQIVASHPKFDPKTFEYDLALLRFYEPVKFQPNIVPICIPGDERSLVGETAWVTGWGRLYEDGPLPSVMQEVDLPVINNTMCEKMYRDAGYVEHIPDIFICAGYAAGGKDSCEGDSGGPMVIQREDGRFMLSGVISWGIGCAEKNQPGVYTRISHFKDWINEILKF